MNDYNQRQTPQCGFAERLIAVIYDEADAVERRAVEAHLSNCSACFDEFAAFGIVRNGIADWRETDFALLETPATVLPKTETAKSPIGGKLTWSDYFGNLFSPANFGLRSAAAFATLAICAGLLFAFGSAIFNRSAGDSIASINQSELLTEKPSVSNNTATPVATPPTVAAPEKVVSEAAKPDVKPIAQPAVQHSPRRGEIQNPKSVRTRNSAASKPRKSDNLDVLAEEAEDDSPRLLSLLDEIEPIE